MILVVFHGPVNTSLFVVLPSSLRRWMVLLLYFHSIGSPGFTDTPADGLAKAALVFSFIDILLWCLLSGESLTYLKTYLAH